MKLSKKNFLFALTLLTGTILRAEEQPAFVELVRPLGMGGAFTAVADDDNIFSFNPAGMVQRTGSQTTLLEIAIGGSDDFKDAYDFISDNENDLTNWENLSSQKQAELINEINTTISKLDPRFYVAADIASYVSGPRFLGLPLHVGFGAMGVVDGNIRLNSGVLVPSVSYSINNDLVFPLSLAHRWEMPGRIPGRLGVGFTGKILRRNQSKLENVSVLQLDALDEPPIATAVGLGADVGLLYQPTDRSNVGVMVRDFMGTKLSFDAVSAENGFQSLPERDTVIRPRTNVGLAMVPEKLFWLFNTHDRWTFAADVRDIFNDDDHIFFENGLKNVFGENLGTHVHLGAEFRYWFLRLRGGASQGYPSFGLGIDIPILKIDYAFYSRELGRFSGDRQEKNHVISLALRFGSGGTESRERINKSKESGRRNKESAVPETPMESAPVPNNVTPSEQSAPATPEIPN